MPVDDSAALRAEIARLKAALAIQPTAILRVTEPFTVSAKHGGGRLEVGVELPADDPIMVNRERWTKPVGYVTPDGEWVIHVAPDQVDATATPDAVTVTSAVNSEED